MSNLCTTSRVITGCLSANKAHDESQGCFSVFLTGFCGKKVVYSGLLISSGMSR
ncbi:hypothetical protein [Amphritea sp.]|uniref:hypothetical protein n=1 Tax=Amphritea sp. TaxID=1872502 RepID=UPI003A9194BC